MCLALEVKNFEFWIARLGETPIVEPPSLVRFSLCLVFTQSENLIYLLRAV